MYPPKLSIRAPAFCASSLAMEGVRENVVTIIIASADFIAAATGFVVGKIVAVLGRRTEPYNDVEEFEL